MVAGWLAGWIWLGGGGEGWWKGLRGRNGGVGFEVEVRWSEGLLRRIVVKGMLEVDGEECRA